MKPTRAKRAPSRPKMTRAMAEKLRAVREVHSARPFVPFSVLLNDGRRLRVEQPYFLAIPPGGRAITYPARPIGFELIPLANVKEVVRDAA